MKHNLFQSKVLNLKQLDLNISIPSDEYQIQMKGLKNKIRDLTFLTKAKNKPVLIVFEGWDAAGKGERFADSLPKSIHVYLKSIILQLQMRKKSNTIIFGGFGIEYQK